MTLQGWILITVYVLVLLAITKPFGAYLFHVFEGAQQPFPRVLGRLEHWAYRLGGVDPKKEQTWTEYAFSVLVFSAVTLLVTYALLRLQHALPLNPAGLGAVGPDLAWNTAVSFTTNTNWQSYGGESTMSYLSQMAALVWHNFLSAGVGLGVGLALARGLTRRPGPDGPRTLGNFWVDLVRSLLYVFLPICIVVALVLVSQGMLQNLAAYREVTTLEGAKRVLAMGPTASQLAIKMFGINGGGFFNANSAHPFENPTPFTNFVEMLLIFAIPSALTYTYGRMAKDQRQGWALWIAMAFLFIAGVAVIYWAEAHASPALHALGVDPALGNMEGKEVRFGIGDSALFATITTDASCGAVNAMHDSFTAVGGSVPLLNIMLGEVIFGGVGAGMYGILVFVILSVFIAGLMVGRTPEYLGKKIQAYDVQMAMLAVLIFPLTILVLTGISVVAPSFGTPSILNPGPHGLSEVLYAYTSGTGNNGSAFGGLSANTRWYNLTIGFSMLIGRFLIIIPMLAIAGSLGRKKRVPPSPGTFPVTTPLFAVLLVSVVLIVGALTFFPALSLGPIVEHLLMAQGQVF